MNAGADWSDLRRSGGRAPGRVGCPGMPGSTAKRVAARLAGVMGFAAAIGGGVYGLSQVTTVLPVERVQVSGVGPQLEEQAVREAVVPFLHDSMMRVDIRGARRALEAWPWVAGASVRRAWPETIAIEIREREALAHWVEGDAPEAALSESDGAVEGPPVLVDQKGQRFEPAPDSIPEGLPRLGGPAEAHEAVVALYQDAERLLDDAGVNVAALHRSPRGAWEARFRNGAAVALGRSEPRERLERFAGALPVLKERRDDPMQRIDLRHPNGFAIAWSGADETD